MSTTDEVTDTKPQGDPELGDAGKRAIQAERDRADAAEKALAQTQGQLKAFIDAGYTDPTAIKGEIDRLTTENSTLTAANETLTGTVDSSTKENTRLKVGLEKGLPADLIDRLRGDDETALLADADKLLAFIPTDAKQVPKADPSQGPKADAGSPDPAQQFADIIRNAR